MLLLLVSGVLQNNENWHARYSWKWLCWENELINIFYRINKNNYLKEGTNVILDIKISFNCMFIDELIFDFLEFTAATTTTMVINTFCCALLRNTID